MYFPRQCFFVEQRRRDSNNRSISLFVSEAFILVDKVKAETENLLPGSFEQCSLLMISSLANLCTLPTSLSEELQTGAQIMFHILTLCCICKSKLKCCHKGRGQYCNNSHDEERIPFRKALMPILRISSAHIY